MCEPPPIADRRVSRRHFLAAVPVGIAGVTMFAGLRAVQAAAGISIVPRSEWGPSLAPTGPVPDEPDVRFLLVHHSVNANTYAAGAVPGLLTGIYEFHTGTKGWPDIAYNFFVDRFGGVWEGRSGSLAGAKAVDATGGSQGFAQLCCFLGDHSTSPPSSAAQSSMGALLGWLAGRHGIDLADGARTRFTSRGSNRYPTGSAVDIGTIAGHRDVSQTACPGDAGYALVADGTFRRLARGGAPVAAPPAAPPATAPATTAAPRTSAPATTSSTVAPTTTASSTTTSTAPTSTTPRSQPSDGLASAPSRPPRDGGSSWAPAAAGAGVLAAVTAGLLAVRARRLP
ncbi:MAG: N-acetylmuramoyl-L-alanine amidase [Acidimicrobiales bacterium]|nr:N-acetylmuramoyl-L-alanine amidase [Acidimicrobiales bacterium]